MWLDSDFLSGQLKSDFISVAQYLKCVSRGFTICYGMWHPVSFEPQIRQGGAIPPKNIKL